jgi:ribosome biogenesis protein NSA1
VVGGYKGLAGAVQQLQLHPTLPLLASVGLDRFVRVHHVHTRAVTHKVCDAQSWASAH